MDDGEVWSVALALDGWSSTSYLSADLASGTDIRNDTVGTLSFWTRRDSTFDDCAVGVSDAGSNNDFFLIPGNSANTVRMKSLSDLINASITAPTANQWVNVIMTQDGSSGWAIYHDAVSTDTGTETEWLNDLAATIDVFTVGARVWASTVGYKGGPLAEVAYWSGVVLSADERSALAAGVNPLRIRPQSRAIYNPMHNVASAANALDDHAWTVNGAGLTNVATHPPVGPRYDLTLASAPLIEAASGDQNLTASPVVAQFSIPTHTIAGSGSAPLTASPVAANFSIPTHTIASGAASQNLTASPVLAQFSIPTHTISGSGAAPLLASPVVMQASIPMHAIAGSGAAPLVSVPVLAEFSVPTHTIGFSAGSPATSLLAFESIKSLFGDGLVS